MDKTSVGKDILSYCGKCKLPLSHIVISLKASGDPAKVQCNTCKANHAYKDPNKVKATKTTAKKRKTSTAAEDNHQIWKSAIKSQVDPIQAYNIATCFQLGDVFEHKVFGPGVVQGHIESDKINVLFENNSKVLMHNKS